LRLVAAALVRSEGGDDINLIQQFYYNGHYGFSGAKVQHVLQDVAKIFICCTE
jgi:hypothetical protein